MNTPLALLITTIITLILGGLLVMLVPQIPLLNNSRWLKPFGGLWSQIGGYIHDTATSVWIPAQSMGYTVGAWTFTIASNVGFMRKTAADNTSVVHIPIVVPQNSVALKGSYLKSIDIWYKVATAALDAASAVVTKVVAPADAAAFPAVVAQTFTYDTGHDTAAERITVASHKMTLTITTPIWLDDDDELYVELTVDAAATSVVDILGARANITLRL